MIRWKKQEDETLRSEDDRFLIVESHDSAHGDQWILHDQKDSLTGSYAFRTQLDCKLKAETLHKLSRPRI